MTGHFEHSVLRFAERYGVVHLNSSGTLDFDLNNIHDAETYIFSLPSRDELAAQFEAALAHNYYSITDKPNERDECAEMIDQFFSEYTTEV